MKSPSPRFGMPPTYQESMGRSREKKRAAESRATQTEVEERLGRPKFEGPQIFTREQFGEESSGWLKKLNAAQEALMKEITNRAMYKGENVDALEAQAALLKQWNDRIWALSLENAHQGLSDPDGVMSVDRELLEAVEGDPMAAVEAVLQKSAYERQIGEAGAKFKEVADLREKMDVLEDRMDVIQKIRKEIDQHEDKMIESGEWKTEELANLDIERSELEKLHTRFFDEIQKAMKKFSGMLDDYEELPKSPFAA